MSIKYRVFIEGEDTGVWTWRSWTDFIAFLVLMHNHTLARIVDEDKPNQFDASYVWPDHSRGERYPTIKKYRYIKEDI